MDKVDVCPIREITKEQFMEIYEEHIKWLNDNSTGKRMELYNIRLRHIDTEILILRKAKICNCHFDYCGLRAIFTESELNNLVFRDCNLSGSIFKEATIFNCSFYRSNFTRVNFYKARLESLEFIVSTIFGNCFDFSSFKDITFNECICIDSTFSGMKFDKCSIFNSFFNNNSIERNEDFSSCTIENSPTFHLSCPETGSFIGFKQAYIPLKLFNDNGLLIKEVSDSVIVKLLIPEDAKRSSADSRKCRCDKAKVLSITSIDEKTEYLKAFSYHDNAFVYEVGKEVRVDNFDDNRWAECAPGIHFFITRKEAVEY